MPQRIHQAAVGQRWTNLKHGFWEGRLIFARFSVVIALLASSTLMSNVLLYRDSAGDDGGWRLLVAMLLAAAAALSATLALESWRRSRWLRQLGASLCGGIVLTLAFAHDELSTSRWTLALGLIALIPLSPYLGRFDGTAFRVFLGRLGFAFILAGAGWMLLGSGLGLVFLSLKLLFGLALPDDAYLHLSLIIGLFCSPLFWLGLVPQEFDLADECHRDTLSARGVRVLGELIAIPLIVVYALILHVYAIKSLLTGHLPEGQSGWLVVGFGLCVLTSLIICRPFMREEQPMVGRFLRGWPWLLPVPLLLLSVAFAIRVADYGVTPQRYLLVAFAVALIVIVGLQAFARTRGDIRWLALVPVVVVLLASFGPQGARAVSIQNQTSRFLASADQPRVDEHRASMARASLDFLAGEGALDGLWPAGQVSPDVITADNLANAWGIAKPAMDGADHDVRRMRDGLPAMSIDGFDLVTPDIVIRPGSAIEITLPGGGALSVLLENDARLVVSRGENIQRFAIDPETLLTAIGDDTAPATMVVLDNGEARIGLSIAALNGLRQDAGLALYNLTGSLLLRHDDWLQPGDGSQPDDARKSAAASGRAAP